MSELEIPNNLRPTASENSADLYDNFAAIATWSATIDDDNMASGYALTPAYASERLIYELQTEMEYPGSLVGAAPNFYATVTEASPVQGSQVECFRWDSSIYSFTGRTTKLRLSITAVTGLAALGASVTFGLYPVTSLTGNAGFSPHLVMGTVVAGSQVTLTTPAAETLFQTDISFAAPSTGSYVIGKTLTGNAQYMAVTGRVTVFAE